MRDERERRDWRDERDGQNEGEPNLSTSRRPRMSRASRVKDRITCDDVVSMDRGARMKSYRKGLTDHGAFDTRALSWQTAVHFLSEPLLQHQDSWSWTRRSFLKTSVVGLLLFGSRLLRPSAARANELPDGELTFFNVHTNERLRVRYRDDAGNYDLAALDEVNHILRCHHTGEVAAIDVQLLEHVNLVHKAVNGTGEIHVISGYRSPEYNAQLVKRSRRVAQHSLHIQGQALDFYVPGVRLREIRHAALKLQYGGVGFYPRAKFIHLDCGPFRTW